MQSPTTASPHAFRRGGGTNVGRLPLAPDSEARTRRRGGDVAARFRARSRARATVGVLAAALLSSACKLTVDATHDAKDVAPGDGVCADDTGACTLRAAIMEANADPDANLVAIPPGTYSVTDIDGNGIPGTPLSIDSTVRLHGAGSDQTIISGNGTAVLFRILSGASTELQNLRVTEGFHFTGDGGGAIKIVSDAKVRLQNLILDNNASDTYAGALDIGPGAEVEGEGLVIRDNFVSGEAAAIRNNGTLRLRDSVLRDNVANFGTGAVLNGPNGHLEMRNVTVSGNTLEPSAGHGTGAIRQLGSAELRNVTVTANRGHFDPTTEDAGGIATAAGASTLLLNSIVADNTLAQSAPSPGSLSAGPIHSDCVGPLAADSRYSLVRWADGCGFPADASTFVSGVSAKLASLGAGTTHALAPSSPARDAGSPAPPGSDASACERFDQRGVRRVVSRSDRCDMGAHEYNDGVTARVTGFTLIDADGDVPLGTIDTGETLFLDELPAALSVRAEVEVLDIATEISSVVFDFDDAEAVQTEHAAPFALGGDNQGDFAPFPLEVGTHTVRATPFTGANGTGTSGLGMAITFLVLDEG